MDAEIRNKIEETVLEILKNSNLNETTMSNLRELASKKLQIDLSEPTAKKVVKEIVNSFLVEQQSEAAEEQEQEEDGKEYDDQGGLIICRLSNNKKVTISEFKGNRLVSIREYYNRHGKELPTQKGVSLTAQTWAQLKENIPAIEEAIKKMEARL